jgi:hypothetical protein
VCVLVCVLVCVCVNVCVLVCVCVCPKKGTQTVWFQLSLGPIRVLEGNNMIIFTLLRRTSFDLSFIRFFFFLTCFQSFYFSNCSFRRVTEHNGIISLLRIHQFHV